MEQSFFMNMNEIDRLYSLFLKHPRICTDSRKEAGGAIFFALSGDNYDGNRFAEEALRRGAALAVVDDPALSDKKDARYFWVQDVLKALQELAQRHRQQFSIPILAITGTNGKTTTKELISGVLETEKEIIRTRGNLNNHIGVPLTLLSLKKTTEIAVVEMGANHPGEIETLCNLAGPTHGIITNIGKAHLEGFGSYEGVIKTKNELYVAIRNAGGTLFVNQADPLLMDLSRGVKRITYGVAPADVSGRMEDSGPFLKILWDQQDFEIQTRLYGNYNFLNVMAGIAVGNYFGISTSGIKKALEKYSPKNNRSQVIKTDRNTLILDAYNANPGSMPLAIENFSEQKFSNKMLILGDMFELGSDSQKEHQRIIDLLEQKNFKQVILVGKEFFQTRKNKNYKTFKTTPEAADYLKNQKPEANSILIKGSRGMQLETLVKYL